MRSRGIRSACAALMLAAVPARAEFPGRAVYQTVEVGPGVYAFISPETSGPIPSGNVLAVIGDDGVLVVDSGRFPALARRMVAEIRRKTDRPVRYLVHTHWHLDHIAADASSATPFPEMAVVATGFTRRKMVEKQIPYLKDLAETDAGYVQYLESAVAKGTRRDGSPMSEDLKRYLASQVARPEARAAGARRGPRRRAGPDLRARARIFLGAREVRVLFLGRATPRATPSSSSRTRGSSRRGSPRQPRPVRLRLPSGGLDPDARGAHGDRRRRRSFPATAPSSATGATRRSCGAARGGRRQVGEQVRGARRSSRRRSAWTSSSQRKASPATASTGAPRSTISSCAPRSTAPTRRRKGRWPRSSPGGASFEQLRQSPLDFARAASAAPRRRRRRRGPRGRRAAGSAPRERPRGASTSGVPSPTRTATGSAATLRTAGSSDWTAIATTARRSP